MKIEDFMLPCPTKKFLGIECFGCGTQRAIVLVFEGKFTEAFHMFPAVYTLLLFFGFVIINFIDRKRSYGQVLIFLAIINSLIMVFSYFYKHFF
ncbi:DUF2752 domain-containing protein [Chryseobacterium wangxinyae]|uniref:DUF2752 domain-containing protein n=1 Tax=unclassified Chryseobacterium TaxID=2593645 RepID=UPI00226F18A0|nr:MULTISPECIES: DUF2752 domain-containing protein [unclassified Chryseobacterium]MCY0969978.1 DUF2752 domain-containing protein [Chryseobacterium sp. CY353]MCY0977018.1 DUF2752 domain-containing protein [Chryseobacterium sp. CY350]WBZ97017.1 DUF2752 domain-containing protein [Chryseobacterium sp. CY350]